MRHAQETPLSFDSRVDSFNSDPGSELRPDYEDQNNKGSVHKEARETPGSARAATRLVHLSTSGPHECDSPASLLVLTLDSSWTNTIGIGSAQSAPHHFYAVDHSAHTLTRWPLSPPLHWNNTSLDGPGRHHFIGTAQVLARNSLHGLTLRFSSPRGCARFTVRTRGLRVCVHWLLHKTLLPSNQTHSHQVHQFPFPVTRQPVRSDVSNV